MKPMVANTAEMLAIRALVVTSGLRGGFNDAGFNWMEMQCENVFYAANETADQLPKLEITDAGGLKFHAVLASDFRCTKPNDPKFHHVFRLTTTPITFSGRIVISPGLKISVSGLKFDFNVAKVD